MTPTLVIALHHAAPAVAALRAACPGVEVRGHVVDGMSNAYHAWASYLRRDGRILPGLVAAVGATGKVDAYERVVLVTWSAPYALVEDLLAIEEDADAVAGWCALDSGYGLPTAGVVGFASRARRRECLYFASYTDIETAPAYPSSRSFCAAVEYAAGGQGGLFDIHRIVHDAVALHAAPDKGAFWRDEHVRALHSGPARLAAALTALDGYAAHDTDPAPGGGAE